MADRLCVVLASGLPRQFRISVSGHNGDGKSGNGLGSHVGRGGMLVCYLRDAAETNVGLRLRS